ncbi:hypothetical protein Poly30_53160 [Planctomycetes bacterium Poly30]|uniref:Tetratricopeptide repeat protein n=1 Tax=Saltatorellus ferox TaxID=2528018 RepID=A0A518F085_9BACT|nr:hypothetical protein Poly30_53160 [Planctomycetes bacterium Poly30]
MQRATTALFTRAACSAAALSLLNVAALAAPDRIYQSNGSILEDVTVVEEGLGTVTYKPSGSKNEETVDSELVLDIEFSNKPEEVAMADVDASNEAFGSALAGMQNYLENLGGKNDKKFPWAPNYARYRIVELSAFMNDVAGMSAAVDALVAAAPDSRYAPLAMIDKIETLLLNGNAADAKASAAAFKEMIAAKGLTQRWKYEQELLALRADTSKRGEALESALQALSRSAAVFPTVTNAADVATAESMLARSEFAAAEELFRGVTEASNADDATMAAAFTGLGDCLYRRAEAKASSDEEAAKALFGEAQLAFMRTVVNYRLQYAHVAKAAFYAGRCFQQIGGEGSKEKSSKLLISVIVNFKGSKWAESAKEFQKRNR